MSQSETTIMTGALIKLGAEPILSADDDSTRARLCKLRFPTVRDNVLQSHPWRFATAYVALSPITPKPVDNFEFAYVFQLPDDCLSVLGTSLGEFDCWEELENKQLGTNISEVTVKFIRRVTDVNKFSPSFISTLEYALARDLAYPITQSDAKVQAMDSLYKAELSASRFNNSRPSSTKQVQSDEWLLSRRY